VTVTRAAFDAMAAHARAAYPDECCGLLTAPAGRPREILAAHPCRNLQNDYHARFPDEYPRDARTAYLLDYRDLERVAGEAETRGERLVGIFHSHIDVGAYFSAEDERVALMGGDTPAFPEFTHIVLDTRAGGVHGGKAFRWDEAARAFVETLLEVVG
jgi:proteasome lid subunit RPN8/RPN11